MAEDYYEKKAAEALDVIAGRKLQKGNHINAYNEPATIEVLAEWLKQFKQEKVDAANVGAPSKSQSRGKGVG